MKKRYTAMMALILYILLARTQSGAPSEFGVAEIQVSGPGNSQAVRFLRRCLKVRSI